MLPEQMHVSCRKNYIKQCDIKRKRDIESTGQVSIPKRKSQMPSIDIRSDYLHCPSPIQDYNGPDRRVPCSRKTNINQAK